MKRKISLFMVVVMMLSFTSVVFADSLVNQEKTIITLENGDKVTEEELIEILESYEGEIYKISSDSDVDVLDDSVEKDVEHIEIRAMSIPMDEVRELMAGTWYIPGVGEVVVTLSAIYVGGVLIGKLGSWTANKVESWLIDRAEAKSYKSAKEKGTKTKKHSVESGKSSLPGTSKPNSSKDLKDSKGIKQRRYYDSDGDADMDIDYRHGGVGHTFPHRHDWKNGKRGSSY